MAKTFWLNQKFNINLPIWTLLSPSIAALVLAVHLIWHPSGIIMNTVTAIFLMGSVFAAVHHAEVIAHKGVSLLVR